MTPLGEGAFCQVWRARPADADRNGPADYAIKRSRPDRDQLAARALLRREASVAGSVQHPNLAAVLAARTDHDPPFVVMPFLEGASLSDALRVGRIAAESHALWIARQVAQALGALHQAGWIHCDVKSANVHVAPSGHTTLMDLGLCAARGDVDLQSGAPLRGTPQYLAPEMISPACDVDAPADVYSLGVTLYQMLTGHLPFESPDIDQLALAHLRERAPDPRTWVPSLPREVADLVQEMLAKQPLRRPCVAELVGRLVNLEIRFFDDRVTRCAGPISPPASGRYGAPRWQPATERWSR